MCDLTIIMWLSFFHTCTLQHTFINYPHIYCESICDAKKKKVVKPYTLFRNSLFLWFSVLTLRLHISNRNEFKVTRINVFLLSSLYKVICYRWYNQFVEDKPTKRIFFYSTIFVGLFLRIKSCEKILFNIYDLSFYTGLLTFWLYHQ